MKRTSETKANLLAVSVLLILLSVTLVFNLLSPQSIISYAVLGITLMATLFQLKKINLK